MTASAPWLLSAVSVAVGAGAGALLRWLLAVWLNAAFPQIPPGTLVANLVGGYLVGVAVAFFLAHPGLAPHWRLLVVTGFLGGLTTFSAFSAEVVANLLEGRWAMALAACALHLFGSLAMTALGIATVHWLRGPASA